MDPQSSQILIQYGSGSATLAGWALDLIYTLVRPGGDWLCPVCQHRGLVQTLELVLTEVDYLAERQHLRMLAALKEQLYAGNFRTI